MRFFGSPLAGPDYPWHVLYDLQRAFGLSGTSRKRLVEAWRRAWPERTRTVETEAGPLVIVPYIAGEHYCDWLAAAGHDVDAWLNAVRSEMV